MSYYPLEVYTREMQVYRNGTLLNSGDPYVPGEELVVKISIFDASEEVLYHTLAPGQFLGGYCKNSDFGINYRVAYSRGVYYGINKNTNSAILVMPSGGSGPVIVWAGWAGKKGQISLTPQFTLSDSNPVEVTVETPLQIEQPRKLYF